jgi:hypothetical protein
MVDGVAAATWEQSRCSNIYLVITEDGFHLVRGLEISHLVPKEPSLKCKVMPKHFKPFVTNVSDKVCRLFNSLETSQF